MAVRQFALDLERMAGACVSVQATRADMARVVPVLHDMFDGSCARLIGRAVYTRDFGACKLERVVWDQLVRHPLRFGVPPGVRDTEGTDDALVAAPPTGGNKSAGQVSRHNQTCAVSSPNGAAFILGKICWFQPSDCGLI